MSRCLIKDAGELRESERSSDTIKHVIESSSTGLTIRDFYPRVGLPGVVVEIYGKNFSPVRDKNKVTIGGVQAIVFEANQTKLKVITSPHTKTGPVEVEVDRNAAIAIHPFTVSPIDRDTTLVKAGPPLQAIGVPHPQSPLPAPGTLNVLLVFLIPPDLLPSGASPTDQYLASLYQDVRETVKKTWTNVPNTSGSPQVDYANTSDVHNFYDQVSYHGLYINVDTVSRWYLLFNNSDYYISDYSGSPNVLESLLPQLWAEGANAAILDGYDLHDYDVMACVVYLGANYGPIRCYSKPPQSTFYYSVPGKPAIAINLGTHAIGLIAIDEKSDWQRCAHEMGHYLLSMPQNISVPGLPQGIDPSLVAVLQEDLYSSDMIDPNTPDASAQEYDLMGDDQSGPIFSAFNMEQLGFYKRIFTKSWDGVAYSQDFDVVAHDLNDDPGDGRYHLIKIPIYSGLCYYIEVRQRSSPSVPGQVKQIFDHNITLEGNFQKGGVIVTKVITGTVNTNQEMRFITLLNDPVPGMTGPCVMEGGRTASDPARGIKITVVDPCVQLRPLVCRVNVQWGTMPANDPHGMRDLWITPWDSHWQSPDIWVLHDPPDGQQIQTDSEGRPLGNGQRPIVGRVNKLYGRVNCSMASASNVVVYFYSAYPPGIGDNGNWAWFANALIANVPADDHVDAVVDWVPQVGQHTCIKVYIGYQNGETIAGNNMAQENFFDFDMPGSSMPDPVIMQVAVRNPLSKSAMVFLDIAGVPDGFIAHFPHSWLSMAPFEERILDLLIVPTWDYLEYARKEVRQANIRVSGYVSVSYHDKLKGGMLPASRMLPIGGITVRARPKKRVKLLLKELKKASEKNSILLEGLIMPAIPDERIRVELIDTEHMLRVASAKTDDRGMFHAIFDFRKRHRSGRIAPIEERILPGTYRAQAFIVDSPCTAQAESNVIYIRKKPRNV